jgi:hypothetical protein
MAIHPALLHALVIVVLSFCLFGIAQALGLSLTLDAKQQAAGAAILVGALLTYGRLVRISSKRG